MSTSVKPQNRGLVMAAVFIATFMTSVEVTIVTTALPAIISDLHGLAYQSWIMSAYLLTTAITTPIYGKLADTIGRRGTVHAWYPVKRVGTAYLLAHFGAGTPRYRCRRRDAADIYHYC